MNAAYGFDGYVVSSPAIAARKGCSTLKSRCGGSGSLGTTTVSWYGRRSPIAQNPPRNGGGGLSNLGTRETPTRPATNGRPPSTPPMPKPPGKGAGPKQM